MTAPSEAQLDDLLRLHLASGLSGSLFDSLLLQFGSVEALLRAKLPDLAAAGVPSKATARKIAAARNVDVEPERRKVDEAGARLVPWGSDEYPQNLKFIFDPPLVLYVRGELRHGDILALALVGSRRCSHYGRGQAERLAGDLAAMGFVILSGLAFGIDASAHRGALACGGRTVAVLGSGLARLYPPEHVELAQRICHNGAVISELPMDTEPDRWNFPKRNRLIAGLSLGVIVVEAARQSGALITARWATEEGREVFAVPGSAASPLSRGPHALIRDGAHLVESADDVVEELGPLPEALHTIHGGQIDDVRQLPLSPDERAVMGSLTAEPKHIDQIIEDTGLEACAVASALLMLQVKRAVTQHPGKCFSSR